MKMALRSKRDQKGANAFLRLQLHERAWLINHRYKN
jgi:hypothetical protein